MLIKENKYNRSVINNADFIRHLWELQPSDINNLPTIVAWIFEDSEKPNTKQIFIKNRLFTSNFREKIAGNLQAGKRFRFVEEVNTGEPIEREPDGSLRSESWVKIDEKRKQLIEQYGGAFLD